MPAKGYIKKKSLSYYLLYTLEKAVDGFVRIEDMYRHGHNYGYSTYLPKSQLSQAIKRLRERGLIEQDQDNIDADKVTLKITTLGKDILGGTEFDESKWDGKWRVVIFDIPEQKRVIRNMFRRKLRHWGFKMWQQSVWVSKQDVTDKLRKTIKELGIEDWIAVLESANISPNNKLLDGR